MKPRTEKDRISAVLFIVVFLLVVVIVIMVLKTVDDNRARQTEVVDSTVEGYQPVDNPNALVTGTDGVPTANPYAPVSNLPTAPTTAPVYTPGNAGTTPGQTQTPSQGTTPSTQQPSNSSEPSSSYVYKSWKTSDAFWSNSGAWLNIYGTWSAETVSETQVAITVNVYAYHQSLYSGSHNGVHILVDDQYFSENAPSIRYESNDSTETLLSSHTFTIDLAQGESRTINIAVEWHYGGEYGGPNGRVKLDTIQCSTLASLSR